MATQSPASIDQPYPLTALKDGIPEKIRIYDRLKDKIVQRITGKAFNVTLGTKTYCVDKESAITFFQSIPAWKNSTFTKDTLTHLLQTIHINEPKAKKAHQSLSEIMVSHEIQQHQNEITAATELQKEFEGVKQFLFAENFSQRVETIKQRLNKDVLLSRYTSQIEKLQQQVAFLDPLKHMPAIQAHVTTFTQNIEGARTLYTTLKATTYDQFTSNTLPPTVDELQQALEAAQNTLAQIQGRLQQTATSLHQEEQTLLNQLLDEINRSTSLLPEVSLNEKLQVLTTKRQERISCENSLNQLGRTPTTQTPQPIEPVIQAQLFQKLVETCTLQIQHYKELPLSSNPIIDTAKQQFIQKSEALLVEMKASPPNSIPQVFEKQTDIQQKISLLEKQFLGQVEAMRKENEVIAQGEQWLQFIHEAKLKLPASTPPWTPASIMRNLENFVTKLAQENSFAMIPTLQELTDIPEGKLYVERLRTTFPTIVDHYNTKAKALHEDWVDTLVTQNKTEFPQSPRYAPLFAPTSATQAPPQKQTAPTLIKISKTFLKRIMPYTMEPKPLATGGFKSVTAIKRYKFDPKAPNVARVKKRALGSALKDNPHIIQDMQQEYQTSLQLRKNSARHFMFSHKVVTLAPGYAAGPSATYMHLAHDNAENYLKAHPQLSLQTRFHLAQELVEAIVDFHKTIGCHNDLKFPNIFITLETQQSPSGTTSETPHVALGDFGSAGPEKVAAPTTFCSRDLARQIAWRQNNGECVTKANDMYVLGGLLATLIEPCTTPKPKPMAELLSDCRDALNNTSLLDTAFNAIQTYRNNLLESLQQIEATSKAQGVPNLRPIINLIVRMLSDSPAERPTAAEAAQIFEQSRMQNPITT